MQLLNTFACYSVNQKSKIENQKCQRFILPI
jgi:hypothetical protein